MQSGRVVYLLNFLLCFCVDRVADLENALLEECSVSDIYCICKGKPLPDNLRSEVWQVRSIKNSVLGFVYVCRSFGKFP